MESMLNAASVIFQFLEEGFYIDMNWIAKIILWIIEGVGIVGVGVIVFTLILRAITTPFDIYQRVKSRKQTLIMRGMQDDLKKLQKQYANDKQMYNQKMMELQKKNGYSAFGACLPMIISMVILFAAIWGFNSYSSYANLAMYENMASEYNAAVMEYTVEGVDYWLNDETHTENLITWDLSEPHSENGVTYTYYVSNDINYMQVSSESDDIYIYYIYSLDDTAIEKEYRIDIDKLYTNQTDETIKSAIDEYLADSDLETACLSYFQNIGAEASAKWFREDNDPSFLWIKNVWYSDVSYVHPIQDYDSFVSSITRDIYSENWSGERSIEEVFTESEYNLLTAQLTEEKEQANGYYIMIVLTIALMVLSQFISMRSQKEMNQYQTVDGQGAKTQKIMMIVMPLIYAITGFMWTAAFSIYIAVSSLVSIITTLISNFFIGRSFKKKEEAMVMEKYTRKLPWQQQEDKKNKKKK